ncbi:MAG: hypothetical protein PWQ59_460 [Thermoanaerobacterium sp.]|nr:hypothetical protein [Thermoanaerobacterium sp.]
MIQDLLVLIGMPILRSVSGWAVKATEDSKITKFELKKLVETIIYVGTMEIVGYFGLTITGVDNAAVISAVAAFFADKLFGALKEEKKVK